MNPGLYPKVVVPGDAFKKGVSHADDDGGIELDALNALIGPRTKIVASTMPGTAKTI